ncbi:Tn3 family transposase (plasmid) [Deinococcus radiomollis]|uniref:Tn3 family transposase n=1 Tax=Deinococcus radiomollis TaxID=468916 RepID=UPI0038914130
MSDVPPATLTEAQREQFTRYPELNEQLLARHYLLVEADLRLVRARRRDVNRLGYAVQLTVLKHLGRGLRPNESPPTSVVWFLADQLRVDPLCYALYSERGPTRFEHFAELCTHFGHQPLTRALNRELVAWLSPRAVTLDQPFPLAAELLDELRRRRILQPPIKTVERMLVRARTWATQQTYRLLTLSLKPGDGERLDALLTPGDARPISDLAWLKQPIGTPKARSAVRMLEKLTVVRSFPLMDNIREFVPQSRLKALAREGRTLYGHHLADFEPMRRRATLMAALYDLAETLTDDVLDLHDRLMMGFARRSEQQGLEAYQQHGKSLVERLGTFQRVGEALVSARAQKTDPFLAIEAVLSWPAFVETVEDKKVAENAEQFDAMRQLLSSYPQVRLYAPRLLELFSFEGVRACSSLLGAVQALRTMYGQGKRTLETTPPIGFIPSTWAGYVFENGGIHRRYYELCVLDRLRQGLRSGDVWVKGSRKYRALDDYLLPKATWKERLQGVTLDVPLDFDAYWPDQEQTLKAQLERIEPLAAAGILPGGRFVKGKLRTRPLKNVIPAEVPALTRLLYARVPRIKITDLMLEVDGWVNFTDTFTNLRSGFAAERRDHLLTAILADGINLGLTRMAEASRDLKVTPQMLFYLSDWHLRTETYAAALSQVVNFQSRQPFAALWGDGTTSSSDGQRFPAGSHGRAHGQVNAKYGWEPGVTFYTHVSDQYAPFSTRVISATARDATYVLDGLLYHQSDLKLDEHYTDTAGYKEHLFALMHLLGFGFVPRIRNLNDTRLYVPDRSGTYPTLNSHIGGVINVKLLRAHWDDVLRLAASIRLGTVTASMIIGKLAAYPQQNGLALALRELGRVRHTLHTLRWLSDPDVSRRTLVGLNKGESRNALAEAVFSQRQGEVQDRSFEAQNQRASGLNLLVALITAWNTVYLTQAVDALRSEGHSLPDELLQHVSPLKWEHIGLTGDYSWRTQEVPVSGTFRPLRKPPG